MGNGKGVLPQGPIEGWLSRHGRDPYRYVPGWYVVAKIYLNKAFLINIMG
jgi:hypothetical protein